MTGARVIRAALPAEAPAITALHARARARYYPNGTPEDGTDWLASWRHAVERPDGQVLCAVERGRITGIASFRRADAAPADTVYLAQFHVDPDLWRRAPAGRAGAVRGGARPHHRHRLLPPRRRRTRRHRVPRAVPRRSRPVAPGTGRSLRAACVEAWRVDGKRAAGLSVHLDNHRARAFGTGLGWTPDPQHPPSPEDHHVLLPFTVTGV
ncbi:GNAT family N-acetyltransferase [Streptomyces europaeiscabiei]|uniref:GNAT family N-acetyltransferase n=1 Tax=Streptomyces europaeiscabiei TaxID=146819 RepID=UPI0038B685E9